MSHFSFNYFGSKITAQILGTASLPALDETVTSHCVPITADGKIIAVDIVNRGVDIPGGHIEENETAEEAMVRETLEEASIIVESPILIDVWKLSSEDESIGLHQKPYLLLYTANVVSIGEFVPNNEVSRRLIVTPDEFVAEYYPDKNQAKKMVSQAFAALGQPLPLV